MDNRLYSLTTLIIFVDFEEDDLRETGYSKEGLLYLKI